MPKFHKLANSFPLISGEAFDELVEDVRANGILEAIVMYEGEILDGRNRWRAAQQLGIPHAEVKFEELVKNHKAPEDPVAFIWSKNAVRRQLTASQRAMAATKLTTAKAGRPVTGSDQTTVKEAADLAGVGIRSVHRARTVIEKGVPEVVEAVESGDLAVTPAAEIAQKPVEIQRKIMEDGPEEAAKVVAIEHARSARKASEKSEGPGRGSVGPKVTMTRQMEGSSAEGSKARTVFWAENKDLIKDLDPELLGQFARDLTAERRALEQLLRLIKMETGADKVSTPRTAGAVAKRTTAPRARRTAVTKAAGSDKETGK